MNAYILCLCGFGQFWLTRAIFWRAARINSPYSENFRRWEGEYVGAAVSTAITIMAEVILWQR